MLSNVKSKRLRILGFLISLTLLCSFFIPTGLSVKERKIKSNSERDVLNYTVDVYYEDENNEINNAASMVSQILLKCDIAVNLRGVSSFSYVESCLDSRRPDAAIYIFPSSLSGITVKETLVTWKTLADSVNGFQDIEHIFGIGNSDSLQQYLVSSENVHIEGSDIIDLRVTVVYNLWTIAGILESSHQEALNMKGEKLRIAVLEDFADNINEIFSKGLLPDIYTGERVPDPINDTRLTQSYAFEEPQYDDDGNEMKTMVRMGTPSQEDEYISLREVSHESGIGGAIGWLVDNLIDVLINEGFDDLAIHVDAAEEINEYVFKIIETIEGSLINWFDEKANMTVDSMNITLGMASLLSDDLFEVYNLWESLLERAFYNTTGWISSWLDEILYQPIQTKISGLAPVFLLRLGTPFNLGSAFASFGAVLRMKLMPSFEIDKTFFESFLERAILGDLEITREMDVTTSFGEIRKFIDVIPLLDIDLAICAFLPTQSDWLQGIASNLEIHFFGSAHFQIAFAPVDRFGGKRSFMEVREWGFHFELDASYTLTLLDFLLPGASGVISTILDYVEPLLAADVTFTLSVLVEIGKEYVGQGLPERSTVLFDIIVGATINIRILIAIFKGTFQVGLRFEQTSGPVETGSSFLIADDPKYEPAQDVQEVTSVGLYLSLYCSLYLGIDLWFTTIGTDCGGPWEETWQLYADTESEDYGDEAADLPDSDEDGLPDAFEEYLGGASSHSGVALSQDGYYLDPTSSDTDGDGLSDKLEIEIFTLPHVADTDGDGLSDGEERLTYLTNPHLPDTDFDNLTDYEECVIYGTNAFFPDTDQDGLRDYFEVTHVWDVSNTKGTFGAVEVVQIGPYTYDDHTDPLNPDTDNDGLVDSEEGYNGIAYANQSIVDSVYYIKEMYVHPLDADTDDDSVRWDYVPEQGFEPDHDAFLMDMSDGVEIHGQFITFIDIEGYPEVKLVKTNPVNPDTDNDTGITLLFNHDGYELSLDPPTNPTNGDTDHDGLLDGVEKIGPYGSATNPNDPDTDNDNLPDYEDWVLPTNQRKPDTDEDGVLDGDEVYKYLTSPINNDTDFDGLSDAEELFFFYCNPLIRDSDLDGLSDGEEVLILLTDPLKPDTDDDGLDDGYEVMISHTEPTKWDTDSDGLGDGEELMVYNSNPLDWDTDDDSLSLPNATGGMSLPWGDGDEVARGTNPTEMDTDSDGLTDSQELHLAKGAPSFEPIPLDPLNNDTDSDGLLDGEELILENVSLITYPYTGLIITLRYGSCPVMNDTDSDGLNDLEEIRNLCDPNNYDTDSDGLTDYAEIYITLTNPVSNDTDGDELVDGLELNVSLYENYTLLSSGFILSQYPMFETDARNGDSDGDLLPDGLEIYWQTDPLDDDSDDDGIIDGHEFDYDGDNLTDGDEFYTYKTYHMKLPIAENHTWLAQPGGFDNPDSDTDGLSDGTEVQTYGTDPTESDSDGDGVNDGEEVSSGGDPLDPNVFPTAVQVPEVNWLYVGAGIGGGVFIGLLLGIIFFKFIPGRSSSKSKKSKSKKSKKKSRKSKKGSGKS